MAATDENKSLSALLIGLAKLYYYNDNVTTNDMLHKELYPNLQPQEYDKLVHALRGLMKSMSATAMDMKQAETFLQAQTRKKDARISVEQVETFLSFWQHHRQQIHSSLYEACRWNKIQKINWRIDVKTPTRECEIVNMPTAIVEILTEKVDRAISKDGSDKVSEGLQFEMDNDAVSLMMDNLKQIDQQLKAYMLKEQTCASLPC